MRLGHVVHDHALAREQEPESSVAEAAPLAGEGTQPLPHGLVAPPLMPAHRLRVDAEQPANATLGEAPFRHQAERRTTSYGIDIGKNGFHLIALDGQGAPS